MWQTMEKIDLPNESLKNSIKKQAIYTLDSNLILKLNQVLSETSLSFEIPTYLLELWINFFKDAQETTTKLASFLQTTENQLGSNELSPMMKTLGEAKNSLYRKLKDYESIFDYYLTSTKSFASQSAEKFRKSTLKNVENLKFIPVNLHLEQFLVEKKVENRSETVSYDFTSVGAFTTVHTNKPMFIKPVDLLMMNDKPFVFTKPANSNKEKSRSEEDLIEHEILLQFFALKLYIQIGDDLNEFFTNWQQIDQVRLNKRIDSISINLNHLSKRLCRSYQHLIEQYAQLVRIEFKQEYFNLAEKMNYYSFKFDAFLIEYKFLSTQFAVNANHSSISDKLKSLNVKLVCALIEFYALAVSDTVVDKFEFVNMCASFSQSFSTLIASIDLKYNRNVNMSGTEMANLSAFHTNNGILIEVESMLSCFSTEHTMVYEHYNSIKCLSHVFIHLPLNLLESTVEQATSKSTTENCFSLGSLQLNIEHDGFHVYLYTHYGDRTTNPIPIYPVLVNVGINEQAVSSNLFGSNLLQKFINSQSILKLSSYFENARSYLPASERKLDSLFERLKMDRSLMDNSRPIELLHIMAEICRLMNGIRVTNCKSGKDRTGVSVSLEQSLILIRYHGLPAFMQQRILDDMRRYGTRIDVVRKNVGQARYAFNKLRYFLLPQLYRPPIELCDDLET